MPKLLLKPATRLRARRSIPLVVALATVGAAVTLFTLAASEPELSAVQQSPVVAAAHIVRSASPSPTATHATPTPTPKPTVAKRKAVTAPAEIRLKAFTTAYTYYDNTPNGSADISNPILHDKAGGVGTYANPITLGVGHSIIGGRDILDYAAGTRFYIPNLRRYFIVEDTCGDGPAPQNGACHTGYPAGTSTWVDMWIDGQSGTESAVNHCASAVTGSHLIIRNPAKNYAVVPGPVFQNGSCTQRYGDTPVY
jgi:hypothetical protein